VSVEVDSGLRIVFNCGFLKAGFRALTFSVKLAEEECGALKGKGECDVEFSWTVLYCC
jgi:hypothetical protein